MMQLQCFKSKICFASEYSTCCKFILSQFISFNIRCRMQSGCCSLFFGLHCLTSNPFSIRGDELSPPRTRVYRAAWWDGETSQIVGESYQDTVTLSIHVLCPYFKLGEVKYYHLFTTTYQEIESWMWFDRSHSVVPWCCVPCSYACLGTYAPQLNDQICLIDVGLVELSRIESKQTFWAWAERLHAPRCIITGAKICLE